MNVVCFYNEMHPKTAKALKEFAPDCIYEDTSGSPSAYWQALRRYLQGTEDVITIEQDIEITEDVIPSLSACDKPWCVYAYKRAKFEHASDTVMLGESLGCTKISVEAQQFLTQDFLNSDIGWSLIDVRLATIFKVEMFNRCGILFSPRDGNGFMTSHVHGEVTHHH